MYIEIKEIGPEGLVVDRVLDIGALPFAGDEVIPLGPIHLTGEFFREPEGTSFAGDLSTVATLVCSRCLESFTLPLDVAFDLLYTTDPDAVAAKEARVDEDRITLTPYDGAHIDLKALVAEQVYLGLPLKPLCRADCQGLCPRCGTNRNREACACREERDADPRLLALKKLL